MTVNRRTLLETLSLSVLAAGTGLTSSAAFALSSSEQAPETASTHEGRTLHDLLVLLFPGFETIDAMGPVEMLGNLEGLTIRFASVEGGIVKSAQGVPVLTEAWSDARKAGPVDWLLVPGAAPAYLNLPDAFFSMVKGAAEGASEVMTVCTGSVLLARTGLLDGKAATSNKNAIGMALSRFPKVRWVKRARWVEDGKFTTSSGLTAGTDMALGFVAKRFGVEEARRIAVFTEYRWNEDPTDDPFAKD